MEQNMAEKFLPIGIQDFENMRQGNFVYVDKTEYIYQLVRQPQAHPRVVAAMAALEYRRSERALFPTRKPLSSS